MLRKLAYETILLTFSHMKLVCFVFIKFNSHMLQILNSFLQNSWQLLAVNYFPKKLQSYNFIKVNCFACILYQYIQYLYRKNVKVNKSNQIYMRANFSLVLGCYWLRAGIQWQILNPWLTELFIIMILNGSSNASFNAFNDSLLSQSTLS